MQTAKPTRNTAGNSNGAVGQRGNPNLNKPRTSGNGAAARSNNNNNNNRNFGANGTTPGVNTMGKPAPNYNNNNNTMNLANNPYNMGGFGSFYGMNSMSPSSNGTGTSGGGANHTLGNAYQFGSFSSNNGVRGMGNQNGITPAYGSFMQMSLGNNGSMYSNGGGANGAPFGSMMGTNNFYGNSNNNNTSTLGSGYGSFYGGNGGPSRSGYGSFHNGNMSTNSMGGYGSSNNLLNGFAVGGGSFYGGNMTSYDGLDATGNGDSNGYMAGNFGGYNNMGMGMGGQPFSNVAPASMMTLNAMSGGVYSPAMQRQMFESWQQQRRLSQGGENNNNGARSGVKETDTIVEGEVTALGRKNSQSNLTRTNSNLARTDSNLTNDKRTGKYFTGKAAETQEYKKDGDDSIKSKNNINSVDPTLDNPIRSILYLERKAEAEHEIETDGNTVRLQREGNDEVTKYDLSRITNNVAFVEEGLEGLEDDKLEDIKRHFTGGCNTSLMLADWGADCSKPATWFSWTILRNLMKNVFVSKPDKAEITMSAVLLEEDCACDLFLGSDERNYLKMLPLKVGESPMFGKVANGMIFIGIDNAQEFNDCLDDVCATATEFHKRKRNTLSAGEDMEHGIMHLMIVQKFVRYSVSQDRTDVLVSSLFVTGVGSETAHYTRILDKNPAEPRELFGFALYRSILSNALFVLPKKSSIQTRKGEDLALFFALLKRFGAMKTRKPNVRSAISFTKSAEMGIEKMEKDLKTMPEGKKKGMVIKQLDRQRLMLMDTKRLLEDPRNVVPSTYL